MATIKAESPKGDFIRWHHTTVMKRATKPDHCFSVTGKRYSPPHRRVSRRILVYA
ncbi:hypothetical protein A9HBioS_4814 [Pseudomonas koreensis]|uniref:Uncharacterized protein n=1 Tax=Pseudomonas koreensis TaxID=198620 RepID=A0AA94JFI5_9PSED|nr:hypothetical protein A9HBioS_4814 [Pseudomonas koreensis]